jgi:hypothetical protein
MTESEVSKPKPVTSDSSKATVDRLFVLDLSGGHVFSLNADGSDQKVIVTECRHPDGIVVDVEAGHIYWTDMGVPNLNDGSIERADLDGRNRRIIIPEGGTFTPKQLHLDKKNGTLYWSDREGMRVMRSNLDGSKIETLVETGQGDADRKDATKWCVGIAVDAEHGQKSIGHRKGQIRLGKDVSFVRVSKYQRVRLQQIAPTLKCYLITCLNQLIWISILATVCCIGQIVAILLVVTQ